jgi:hypothetical protein
MKKTGLIVCLTILVMVLAAPVFADSVEGSKFMNYLSQSEETWLEGLTGVDLTYIGQDVTIPFGDDIAPGWLYAAVMYDFTSASRRNPNAWAIRDDGDSILQLTDSRLPGKPFAHISWFGTTDSINEAAAANDDPGTASVPEPLTALLVGFGLVGWAGVRSIRRRFR